MSGTNLRSDFKLGDKVFYLMNNEIHTGKIRGIVLQVGKVNLRSTDECNTSYATIYEEDADGYIDLYNIPLNKLFYNTKELCERLVHDF